MRPTPHYPPAQPNTSARVDYYNAYSSDRGLQADVPYNDYYNSNATASQRSGKRHRPSPSSGQRANIHPQHCSPVSQLQQRLYQQEQPQATVLHTPEQAQSVNDDFNSVVYTVQDTFTDTQARETDYGGVLTIRTTTVTRTITERLVRSDEDEDSSDDDGEVHLENQYCEGP